MTTTIMNGARISDLVLPSFEDEAHWFGDANPDATAQRYLDAGAATVIVKNGADPVHLGIVICFNLCIGLVSPPLGGCLLIVSAVTKVNYWALAAKVIPFVIAEIIVLGLLVFVPEISLALPRLMGLWN